MTGMTQEVYQITVTHYLLDENGKRFAIEEPVICKHIFNRRFGGSGVVLNRMFDETKAYVLERIKDEQ